MKNFLKYSLSALALMFLFSAFAVTETKAQAGPLGEILKRMDEHNKALKSLKANVVMEKYNSQLDESDVSEGKAMYVPQKGRDAYVRIDWSKPVVESLAVVDKEYILYRPALKQAITGKVDKAKDNGKAPSALAFMNMSKAQLKANYTIKYVGQEKISGGIPTWHIELIPKATSTYKSADLWVDGNGMPIQAKVTENNGDTTTVQLSGLEKNINIDGKVFAINPPKGTKIIKG
jgi:outer membrane lipoprotein-sorting protein